MTILRLLAGALILSSGCAAPPNSPLSLAERVGQPVALEGIAENRKLGAALRGESFVVWVDRLADWPREWIGRTVRVNGVLEEREDLPVHVPQPGAPPAAGMPVAEGTDVRKASRRYVVRDARWSLIR